MQCVSILDNAKKLGLMVFWGGQNGASKVFGIPSCQFADTWEIESKNFFHKHTKN